MKSTIKEDFFNDNQQTAAVATATANRLVVLGDVHGRVSWHQVVAAHPEARFLFLGDYCDPHVRPDAPTDDELVENLLHLIDFKKQHPDKVTLLLGNHDIHYLLPHLPRGCRYNEKLAGTLTQVFQANSSLFDYVHACNKLLFLHACVQRSWFEEDFKGDLRQPVAPQLEARKDDPTLYQLGIPRGGTFTHGGMFWADMEEITPSDLLPGYIQIVGHNRVRSIRVIGDSLASTG